MCSPLFNQNMSDRTGPNLVTSLSLKFAFPLNSNSFIEFHTVCKRDTEVQRHI